MCDHFEMIFQNSENYSIVESKMRPSLNYDFKQEDDQLMDNFLRQNFCIDIGTVDDVEKVRLPPMVPGTKCFADYDTAAGVDRFGRKMILENQVLQKANEKIFRSTSAENVGHLLDCADFYDGRTFTESPSSSLAFFGDIVLPMKDLMNNQVVLPQSEQLNFDKIVSENLFNYKGTLDRKENGLQPLVDDSFTCRWAGCGEQLFSQQALVRHIEKNHIDSRTADDFVCLWQPCPRHTKPFNARYKLLIHMRVHSGEKPNKCPFPHCAKAFSRLENLKIHQRSHTGEKPYACQFAHCTKAFSNSSDRAKHQRTHFDQKPYACQISGCAKRYTDPSSLRKHIKNHSSPLKQRGVRKQKCGNISSFVKKQVNQTVTEKTMIKTKNPLDENFETITYDPIENNSDAIFEEFTSADSLPTDFDIFTTDEYIPYDTVVYNSEVKFGTDSSVDEFIEHLYSESTSPITSNNELTDNIFNTTAYSLEKLPEESIAYLEFLSI